jgi:hypothetical protein
MSTMVAVGISLEVGCTVDERCAPFARPMLEQMGSGRYQECAVMEIPGSVDEWRAERRTARKRASRAERRGYHAEPLSRDLHTDEIHAINTSKTHRQGRQMASGYVTRTYYGPLPDYQCCRHAIRTSGVWSKSGRLVAYLTMYRVGDLALVSQILGHGTYEPDEIMFLLFDYALGREVAHGRGVVVYNRWDSGEDGLREFKSRLGFREQEVAWLP